MRQHCRKLITQCMLASCFSFSIGFALGEIFPHSRWLDMRSIAPIGETVIRVIERFGSLSAIVAVLSFVTASVAIYRVFVVDKALLRAAYLMLGAALLLSAITPFIVTDPPWLSNLPMTISVLVLLFLVQ